MLALRVELGQDNVAIAVGGEFAASEVYLVGNLCEKNDVAR